MNLKEIDQIIKENKIVLFMKGNKLLPQCGFSAKVVQILDSFGLEYLDIDVLEDNELRQNIKQYSDWPTIPQLYIEGEFIGGCDIVSEIFENGELLEMLKEKEIIT